MLNSMEGSSGNEHGTGKDEKDVILKQHGEVKRGDIVMSQRRLVCDVAHDARLKYRRVVFV